jgi:uncharacterized protein YbjT (DUF2867 family)
MNKHKIVVCGATGNQGRAVVENLLKEPKWDVTALTRNTNTDAAKRLRGLGAKLLKADTQDLASLLSAFKGAYGVFGVTQPWSSDYKKCDVHNELEQGRNIISAGKIAGVEHLVFSSIINTENKPTGVSHVDSKLELEQFIKDKGVPHCILRCAQFMDNIGQQFFPVKNGKIKGFIAAHAKVPYVACDDIGATAALIFRFPQAHLFKTYDLIGDFATGNEIADVLAEIHGTPFKYSAPPAFLLRLFAQDFYAMRRWFERYGKVPYCLPMLKAIEVSQKNFKMRSISQHLRGIQARTGRKLCETIV